ncbi:DnaB-like replicative helicase [Mycobacterium phage Aziz]|uniref:DNA 5'-3' helicase n=2 Tax=Reyvirus TaxID=1623301 RepID=A0A1L6BYK4_9CAUD|nr:DnaB-like replicative helicase [Mycobacterium phage Aziz]YP_010013985.1 DnaB-like replicative helicase [Mycobacterium phage MrMagoo]APQ42182.1 DnaB-like dsDNA helicase [Mycobacterium phage MrMagoo]ASR75923.1 DnaB-like dsDNA helicase [Mycobacterium phage GenevaB15]QNJ56736.1 DnaB-like dsDNA helicase [Mycobacterium phage Aziz]
MLQRMYLDGTEIDAITLFAELEKDGKLRRVGGAPYLATLLESCTTPKNAGYYANIVIEKWKLRKVNELGQRFQALDADDVSDIPMVLDAARTFLDEVDDQQDMDAVNFRDLYTMWTEAQEDDRPAIESPFIGMNDRLAGGFQRQRLYVIGARPGCGKTIMGAQLALYAAQLHYKSLVFSLELSKEDLMGRILACGARADYGQITAKRMSAETMAKVSRWAGAAAELTLEVDDRPDHTIESIAQACRIKKQREGLDFVFIDYLQLIESSKGQNRVEAVDHMATRARHIARKLDCVVVVAAQLNRKIEDNGGKPRLPVKSDFRESGGIEQTADAAIVLSRPVDENGEEADKMPMMNVTFVKNRTGVEGTMQLRERFDLAMFQ